MNKMFSKFLMSLLILWAMWVATLTAKLCGLIHWSWWLVLSPAIAVAGITGLITVIAINLIALTALILWVAWEYRLWKK